jgi:hypothetical protein
MRRNARLISAGLALLPGALAAAQNHSGLHLRDRLSVSDSAALARAAMRAELEPACRRRPVALDFEGAQANPHFYFWMAIPTWGQGLWYFSVDRRTGDVWSHFGCKRASSSELTALQTKLRRRFHLSPSQVRDIEREGFPGTPC